MAIETLTTDEQQALQDQHRYSKPLVTRFREQGWHVDYEGPEDLNWIKLTQPGVMVAFRVNPRPSKVGIRNGRISQLEIQSDTAWIYAYDEGLIYDGVDAHPGAKAVLSTILTIAN